MTKHSMSGASLYESSPSDVCTNSHHVKGKKECGQRYFIFFLDNGEKWLILLFFLDSDIHKLERESKRRNEGRKEQRKGKENSRLNLKIGCLAQYGTANLRTVYYSFWDNSMFVQAILNNSRCYACKMRIEMHVAYI